jgi:hypothetical protein
MSIRAWAASGIFALGLSLALLLGARSLGVGLWGQALIAAPYAAFVLLAGFSSSPKAALLLSGMCLVLHLALLWKAWDSGAGVEVLGWFMVLGMIGPGVLALVALVMLALRWRPSG